MVVELRKPTEVGKEAPAFDRQVIGQGGGDDGRLFHLNSVWRSIDNRITAGKGIDVGGDADFAGTELEIPALLIPIRTDTVDDKANRRVELRGESFVRGGQVRPNVA